MAVETRTDRRLRIEDIRTDGGTQPRAQLDMLVIAEYADLMAGGAVFPPVIVFYDGTDYWLADGFHRIAAARRQYLEILAEVRQGTRRDALLYAVGANASHGLRRTNEDKRRAVLTLLNDPEWSAWSDAEIGRRAAVSPMTVGRLRAETIPNNVRDAPERKVERNGTTYTMQTAGIGRPPTPILPEPRPGEPDTVYIQDGVKYRVASPHAPEQAEAPLNPLAVHFSSESDDWHTPKHILDSVAAVLGTIDLDPCSNSHEHPNVPAVVHYTREDDGLTRPWQGRVYMNPPYGRVIGDWIDKLVAEYGDGSAVVTEAIALVPARTDTEWWEQLGSACAAVCFVRGRLNFSGADNSAPFPSAVVYLGERCQRFAEVFGKLGQVWWRIP